MQVTRAGEYGVLGLLCLARRPVGQVVMIEQVSREEQIPRSFLAKIFQSLARAGLVRSVRGTRGGFALARPAAAITTLDIIEAVEGRIAFQRCLQAPARCPHLGGCPLCGLFEQAQTQVKEVFARTTLAGLMQSRAAADLSVLGGARLAARPERRPLLERVRDSTNGRGEAAPVRVPRSRGPHAGQTAPRPAKAGTRAARLMESRERLSL
jgi:Rrf2 family transcriptional regulator, iron-sulfur cluster assembly transcription factor